MKKTTGLAFVFAGILILTTLCPVGAAEVPAKIKAGFMFGMTGAASPIGPVQLDGAKLAVKEINDAGGVALAGLAGWIVQGRIYASSARS